MKNVNNIWYLFCFERATLWAPRYSSEHFLSFLIFFFKCNQCKALFLYVNFSFTKPRTRQHKNSLLFHSCCHDNDYTNAFPRHCKGKHHSADAAFHCWHPNATGNNHELRLSCSIFWNTSYSVYVISWLCQHLWEILILATTTLLFWFYILAEF